MSLMLQKPLSYPLYTGTPRIRLPMLWPSVPFRTPTTPVTGLGQYSSGYPISQPILPLSLPQQKYVQPKIRQSSPPYSNRRYQHLKQSTAYPHRHSRYPSVDPAIEYHRNYANHNEPIYTHQYKPSKTKSVSEFAHISQHSSMRIPKSHSWHTMMAHRQSNLSVAYAAEMHLNSKHNRKRSPRRKRKKNSSKTSLSPSKLIPPSSPKRTPSLVRRKKMSVPISEFGPIRISTLDELPADTTQANNLNNNNISADRTSMKGSISNSTKRQKISKDGNSIKNRKIKNHQENRVDLDSESLSSTSSSSNTSYSSLQQRLNGSLRNDPLITAAMENFQQHRRSSIQNLSSSLRDRASSSDSLSSNSTVRSSKRSRNNSQSSFTSVERSEIREFIKAVKTQGVKALNISLPLTSVPIPVPSPEPSIVKPIELSVRTSRPRKSSLTEELDREFNKLRARDPSHELTYVTPSSICKRKKTIEKPQSKSPPVPTFDELLRQVQLRPVDSFTKPLPLPKEKSHESDYENPLSSVPVPRSSPIPQHQIKTEVTKHEYATPAKKPEGKTIPQISHFQPSRTLSFNKQNTQSMPETLPSYTPQSHPPMQPQPTNLAPTQPPSFNWPQYGLTNPILTTFQPHATLTHQNEHPTTSVKENIYTPDIDVCIPSTNIDKDGNDALQNHLDNQTIVTDDLYTDFGTKQNVISSSILDDFSLLFKRKHKHQNQFTKRSQRCSIM